MITIRNALEEDVLILVEIDVRAWEQAAVVGVADIQVRRGYARDAFLQFLADHWLRVNVARSMAALPALGIAREAGRRDHRPLGRSISAKAGTWLRPACGVGDGNRCGRFRGGASSDPCPQHDVTFFQKRGYSVHWLSVDYSPRLDRDVESIGLRRQLVADEPIGYGPGGL